MPSILLGGQSFHQQELHMHTKVKHGRGSLKIFTAFLHAEAAKAAVSSSRHYTTLHYTTTGKDLHKQKQANSDPLFTLFSLTGMPTQKRDHNKLSAKLEQRVPTMCRPATLVSICLSSQHFTPASDALQTDHCPAPPKAAACGPGSNKEMQAGINVRHVAVRCGCQTSVWEAVLAWPAQPPLHRVAPPTPS